MCLTKTHRLPKISRKPIQVYKVLRLEGDKLITPYQKQLCQVGKTIKAKHSWLKGIFKDKIKGEGVHAYIVDAFAFTVSGHYINHYVYPCEIPPFTPYWVGQSSDIAASKMIIKERVEL